MAAKVMLLLGTFALIVSYVECVQECNPHNSDCFCSDFSYEGCEVPPGDQSTHTNTLEECIEQCDLFATIGACDWLRFNQVQGEDENCHIYAPTRESMKEYLDSCNKRGRPTRNTEKTCYIDSSLPGASSFCDDPARCPGGCKTCDVDDATDPCNGIRETECAYREDGTDDSNTMPSEDGCSFFCSLRGVEYDATYLTFAKREEKCFCYPKGDRFCDNVVLKQGISFDQYAKCLEGKSPPGPGCVDDAECEEPPLCDLVEQICKPGCHLHSQCADTEYCECRDENDEEVDCMPAGRVGTCRLGCRDLGSSCDLGGGIQGTCMEHICTPAGDPKIQEITVTSTGCASCGPSEGPIIEFAVELASGDDGGCETPKLEADFTGGSATFSGDDLGSTVGGCNLYEAYAVNNVTISWSGAGKWTPKILSVNHATRTTCCNNAGDSPATSGQSLQLDCSVHYC